MVITLYESIQVLLLKYMPRKKEGNRVLLSLRWHSVWRCTYVYFLPERRTMSGSHTVFSFTLVSFLVPLIHLLFLELLRVPHEIQITCGMRGESLHFFFLCKPSRTEERVQGLRSRAALEKNSGWAPRTHIRWLITTLESHSRGPDTF